MEIVLDQISKSYFHRKKEIEIIQAFSQTFKSGNLYLIKGESGRGKTTLLTMIALLQDPDKGKILFDNTAISQLSSQEKARIRRERIGIIFQDYNLFSELTVLDNVMMAEQLCAPKPHKESATIEKRAKDCIELLGLTKRMEIPTKFLSGGEQQRTSIARAILKEPALLVCDEPVSNLDPSNISRIVEFMDDFCHQRDGIAIISSHEQSFDNYADEIISL